MRILAFLLLSLTTLFANAYPIEVTVDAKANGGFGPLLGGAGFEPDLSILEMVEAISLSAGDQIVINTSGSIFLAPGEVADANGRTDPAPNAYSYLPLEESAVDSGALSLPRTDLLVSDFGALMAAFIDSTRASDPDFLALNSDPDPDFLNFTSFFPVDVFPDPIPVGDILAEELFLVGAGPFSFTAPYNGSLFLGVNDMFVPNNSGALMVAIEVPVPTTFALLILGLFVLRRIRSDLISAGQPLSTQSI